MDEEEDGFCVLIHGFQPENRIRVLAHFDQIGEIRNTSSDEGNGWIAVNYERKEAQKRAIKFDGAFVGGAVVGVTAIESLDEAEGTFRLGNSEPVQKFKKMPRFVNAQKNGEALPHIHDSAIKPETSPLDWVYSTVCWVGKSIYSFIKS
jgi:hypothetical protein